MGYEYEDARTLAVRLEEAANGPIQGAVIGPFGSYHESVPDSSIDDFSEPGSFRIVLPTKRYKFSIGRDADLKPIPDTWKNVVLTWSQACPFLEYYRYKCHRVYVWSPTRIVFGEGTGYIDWVPRNPDDAKQRRERRLFGWTPTRVNWITDDTDDGRWWLPRHPRDIVPNGPIRYGEGENGTD